jgi:hypothetical protein
MVSNGMAMLFNPDSPHKPSSVRDDDDTHWMCIDTGANMHFISRRAVLSNHRPSSVVVTTLGPEPIQADFDGDVTGYFEDENEKRHRVFSEGTFLSGTRLSLFSGSRATAAGHTIIFEDRKSGKSGIILASGGEFIPFTYCPETRLWWIPLHRRGSRDPWASSA